MPNAGDAYEECFIESSTGLSLRHVTYNKSGQQAVVWARTALDLIQPDPMLFEIPEGNAVSRGSLHPES
jgi:hypothetical protein